MKPYYEDPEITLYHGANLDVLPHIPAGSVNCVVTSPPYFGLRDYGVAGQYGAERSPAEYVGHLVATFREIHRALADDGVAWLNLGDSYYSGKGSPTQPDLKNEARRPPDRVLDKSGQPWAKPKNLLGIPWRTAFALQDDGWVLRNAIVWHKSNAMPESVTDRLSQRYEMLFLFSKAKRYWFDLDPIREALANPSDGQRVRIGSKISLATKAAGMAAHGAVSASNINGKNPGDVWTITTKPFAAAHFATFPPELPRRCIVAGCKPGGVVLDPFHGSGTTGMVARQAGRQYIGIELSAEYLDLSLRTRLADPKPIKGGAA